MTHEQGWFVTLAAFSLRGEKEGGKEIRIPGENQEVLHTMHQAEN